MEAETEEKLTASVDEAAVALGIGRNQAYDAIKRGEIPNMRIGGRIIVLWRPLMKRLKGE